MYLEYYGLEQPPFSITPDPHYVFLSEHHRDALAHLLYGIRQGGGGGFVQLTGEVGTGKTTLSRLLLNQLPENTHAALVLNPRLDPVELLETICEELRLRPASAAASTLAAANVPADVPADAPTHTPADARRPAGKGKKSATGASAAARAAAPKPAAKRAAKPAATPTAKALYDQLSAYLLQAYARGERVVLIVDEAQNLSADALEQVRLLTNLETETQKLLQIILIGQPELRDTLMRPDLRQLAQRITARYHLRPLDEAGTAAYVRHRLNTAGASRFPFSPEAVRRLHRRSGGVPRLINVVAERALLGGYAHDLLTIDAATVERAANEALAPTAENAAPRRRLWLQAAALAVTAAAFAWLLMRWPTAGDAGADVGAQAGAADQAVPARIASTAGAAPAAGATTAAAPSPEPGAEDLPRRIRDAAAGDAAGREWAALLKAWNAPAAMRALSADACPAAPAPGWRCLRSRASLDQLTRANRPVLLRVRAEPHAAWARLLGADDGRVRLSLAAGASSGGALSIDRVALAGVWNGEYLAIWPAPAALEARYAAGDAAAVAWVRERLRLDGANTQHLTAALRAFQARQGLPGDGRLRADTEFALSARGDGPRLARAAADDSAE